MAEQGHDIITRPIPSTGERIAAVGLGTWQRFDVRGNGATKARLAEVVRTMLEAGASVIDTSPMYGRAEAVVGELLQTLGARSKAFVATKVWTTGRENGIAQMRRSFELLRVDVIDLMQVHNLVDWRIHLATMREMKEQGKIRYIGITHYTASALPALEEIMAHTTVDFVQLAYSIAEREAEERALPIAAERGVAVLVNRPFATGELFYRVRNRALPPLAQELGCASWAEFMLKYVLSHPAVTCVIPATGVPEHMVQNLRAARTPLPDEAMRRRMAALWDSL